ncbi:MAG: hydrogenase, partial [Deltaproteobacteria bacterium]|nr:hydrogenase [Deltaproteobacteria bacterium]
MFKIIAERLHQKYRTVPYPAKAPALPPRFRGRPVLREASRSEAENAAAACPANAFRLVGGVPRLDMGLCIFCGACERVSPNLVSFSGEHRLAGLSREE